MESVTKLIDFSFEMKTFTQMVIDDCLLRSKKENLTLDASIFYGASGF